MDAILHSFLLVAASEMGDKTQLLALVLATRFRKPFQILAGILVATLLNHALASWAGGWISGWISPMHLRWALGATFLGFALWILRPDSEDDWKHEGRYGAFVTTVITFFLAEMGDKTQLATVALGARFASPWLVTIGTTAGMLAADGPAVFFGEQFTARVPLRWVRWIASALFFLFGILVLLQVGT